ncbi:ATP-binding sensor histidine kinase [Kamptonema sp. UHCC 0994]|uniref:trifunctional serine/threonine-protein kinase/ATP-binding protein/sensor histidine kinase n=1 Tax=Kamptonema sp. UHCC 0994 TaxID=3031329 RepID=UPI0023B93702|nr:ATP-binding sensor histidine kinase [Kamptonema sp. UHCC 0994]MDF0552376.1 AAA family ATPase [Kamptonema sp. UHCC 0994]
MNAHPNFSDYQITEELYIGTRTLVYRGIRTNDQKPIVIKILRNEYPNFTELLQFRNQYTIAKNLNFPSIIQPLALEPYRNSYTLVMEDFGGVSLSNYLKIATNEGKINKYLPLAEFINIAIQLTDILDYLYQNRVIHKDIKPANILINPDTKQVKLIDFSISSLLPRETQEIQNPNILEGTLAYLSPEQTGRMNRGIDYRSDFYSLGVTLYELLTGELPFVSEDAMELVHCHLAKHPIPIHQINFQIPLALSEIVSKLMAKNAEYRYQTALGIKHDLEICLKQLQTTGQIESFEIGKRDISDRFTIPEKLYGRENEVDRLLAAFERVSTDQTEMMLVAGFSGIGKTAVVNEVHKPIVRQRGYFIKGKYDQFQRNIPFSAFVQAFRDLMGQLLSESDDQLHNWKNRILAALGDSGQVLIDVIPELENIIGKQLPATELSGSAAQNRFNLLFQKFVQVFTSIEHPLVMFLDDLQWADSASLNLLKLLLQDTGYLLVLGAYRDNEVSPVHPFILTVDEIVKTGATVNTITLPPLRESDMNQLVADTLNCDLSLAKTLTKLVYQKTQGNPFFATQFLKALHDDKLISFNWDIQHWQCDIAQVNALALTDDVVEFMALQLQKLPTQTQDMLKLAACIGAEFDLNTLIIVSEQSAGMTATALWKALQEGLVIPTTRIYKFFTQLESEEVFQASANPTYRFLHDRVQQAAYSLIPESHKKATHLKIGQLLQQNLSEIEQEEKLFDIVGHLNQGKELITAPTERETLAKLNLKAGVKARNSTAYIAAKTYLQIGIELLTEDCWLHQYELTLNLYVAATEVAYLNADLDKMEEMAALVLQEAQTILDKIKIYKIQIVALTAQSQMLEAIAVARDALSQLGVELPTAPDETKIGKALENLANLQSGRGIQELIDLPVMSDPQTQAAMQLLGMLFATVFQGMPGLMPILSATMVSLSLQFGNTPASTAGYAIHGMVLCAFLGEVETGYSFGRLGLNLLERFNVGEFKCTVLLLFGGFIQHRQESLRAMMLTVKDGYATGMETGDFLNAGYCTINYFNANLFGGVELDIWEPEIAGYRSVLVQTKQYSAQTYLDMVHQLVRNLRETRILSDCLIGNAYDETVMIPKHHQDNDLTSIAFAYIYKLFLAYFFGNYTAALDHSAQAKKYLMAASAMIFIPVFHFYAALTYLALFSTQPEPEQAELLTLVEADQTTLKQWAQNAPMNHLHKWYLVEAEKYRVLGNKTEAIEHYDRAICLAKENKFVNEEALANELAMKFYLEWGKEKFAQIHAIEAYYCYARWGAKAKVNHLEQRYPQLLAPILQQPRTTNSLKETLIRGTIASTHTSSTVSEALDLATLLKASQAISGEIELNKLLTTLLEIVIANAGASKCVLLLKQDTDLKVVALVAEGESPQLLSSIPLESSPDIAISLVNNVKRTLSPLVLADARISSQFAADIYIQKHQPKSVICSPIMNQGLLIGVLYLENNLTVGAFTSDRVEVLNLICAQAAISLENARLYQAAQQALTDLKQAQLTIVQSEKMSALGNLIAGVAHEINNPVGFLTGNIEPALDYINDLLGLIDLVQEKYPQLHPEIQEEIENIELEYIREDLPKLVGSMREGVKRIQDISTSLRTFSRADTDRPIACNIHDGIDSTLMILKHRLKANKNRPEIKVIKDYGNLPQIECLPGQLNQVFMNILANAIDALDESNIGQNFAEIKANSNQIKITTSLENQAVKIAIADNGKGMNEEVKEKIFDHLFTTKGVGKGTGLGLAIAQQIIEEKHGGKILVNSVPGEGTVFSIAIPVK